MRITFLGGAGTVTGSKYLVEYQEARVLIDCGLFQGYKQLRLRNREAFAVDPASLDAVILTHAHLDHSGYLPALVRDGFRGPVYATAATAALAAILLPDSGRLQEEEAEYANRRGSSKHHPALPLYTEEDALRALAHFRAAELGQVQAIAGGMTFSLRQAGHILGAAMVELTVAGKVIVFSGDLGRPHDPVMCAPATVKQCDYLLVESTYGNRRHPQEDTETLLADIIQRTVARGGIIVIPSFAVERAQILLYHLYRLRQAGRIPMVPIYLNSPMARDVTDLFLAFRAEHKLSPQDCAGMCHIAHIVQSVEES
ncbi:MBL fold metallo-hydrolase, partial [Craterilacuibacter sp.]|uniref:MBL fold metallo-hydrolase n=1 Tax=Craterilacuibacter sp. TaxID=2870909 RepID=UPI003F32F5AF